MKFMAEKPYYPIPLPSIASIGTVLSIKPMRVSEAWRFTHILGNYWLKRNTICQEIIICKYYALWIYVMLQIMSTD